MISLNITQYRTTSLDITVILWYHDNEVLTMFVV